MTPNSFPKIFAVGTKPVQSIFLNEVEVTEKIDGSQIGFGVIKGELIIRSKGTVINLDDPDGMFVEGVRYIQFIKHRLMPELFYYGEYLRKPKHNTLIYDRTPTNYISLFGIWDTVLDDWIAEHSVLTDQAARICVDVVPLLFKGEIKCKSQYEQLMNTVSYLGGANIEGIVIKNYTQQARIANDIYTPFMSAKHVSEHFKEVHRGRWKSEEKPKGKWESFCEGYRTPARWEKAIIHLRERGELTDTPKDIGSLLKEINNDIEAEEKEEIKDFLYVNNRRELLTTATKGFAEWYKDRIASESVFMEMEQHG